MSGRHCFLECGSCRQCGCHCLLREVGCHCRLVCFRLLVCCPVGNRFRCRLMPLYFLLCFSRRSNRSRISGVRGMDSLPLLPLELEAAEDDPPRSMPEVRSSLTLSPIALPSCLRGANMFCSSVGYMLSKTLTPRALGRTVGGAGVPKSK